MPAELCVVLDLAAEIQIVVADLLRPSQTAEKRYVGSVLSAGELDIGSEDSVGELSFATLQTF